MDGPLVILEGDRLVVLDFAAFEGAARFEACALMPSNVVDGLGNDRGDYATILMLDAMSIQETFRERYGYCGPAERRYVKGALRKRRVSYQRRQRTHEELFGTPLEVAPHPVLQVEGEIEARDALRLLGEELSDDEFDLLMKLGLADGNVAEVYAAMKDECTRRWFHEKIKRLRRRALTILRDFYFQNTKAEAIR